MNGPAPLSCHREASPHDGRHAFFSVSFDGGQPPPESGGVIVRMPLRALGPGASVERWTVHTPPRFDERDGFRIASTDDLLFGVTEVAGHSLEHATREAYERMLALCAVREKPHLLRVWSVLPDINACTGDADERLDVYSRFCRARGEAFAAVLGPRYEAELCASTVVGTRSGAQLLYFLAGREPGEHHENPRQVSAWRYPRRYGPRSPSFARATTAPAALGGIHFLSGTASIVGHRSRHPGSLEAQLDETLRNIAALRDSCARPGSNGTVLRVYLRHAAHRARAAQLLRDRCNAVDAMYVEADLCRAELLVEIEGAG